MGRIYGHGAAETASFSRSGRSIGHNMVMQATLRALHSSGPAGADKIQHAGTARLQELLHNAWWCEVYNEYAVPFTNESQSSGWPGCQPVAVICPSEDCCSIVGMHLAGSQHD